MITVQQMGILMTKMTHATKRRTTFKDKTD